MLRLLSSAVLAACAFGSAANGAADSKGPATLLATFDAAPDTTWRWNTINDYGPISAGRPNSSFFLDDDAKVGVWHGQVTGIVMGDPGFTMMRSLDGSCSVPDLSGAKGLVVRARQAAKRGLNNFALTLSTGDEQTTSEFTAKLRLTDEFADYVLPWDVFTCDTAIAGSCPALSDQLSSVRAVALSTASFGVERGWGYGQFRVEIASIAASGLQPGRGTPLAVPIAFCVAALFVAVFALVALGFARQRSKQRGRAADARSVGVSLMEQDAPAS